MTHEQALEAIRATLEAAPAPLSVAVVDDHGELVACVAMDGAARDTLENARRKAYTAARSDATSTRALAEKVGGRPTELASFDPQFSFFHGGVAAFSDGRRVGAVGVSGLPGPEDERLAVAAIAAAASKRRRGSQPDAVGSRHRRRPGRARRSVRADVTRPRSRPR